MRPYFPTEELRQENERLMEMFLNTKENIDVNDFIKENASPEYIAFLKSEAKRKEELFKKGVLV